MHEADVSIYSCTRSTSVHALLAKAGLFPVADRHTTVVERFLAKAGTLLTGDGFRLAVDTEVTLRLITVSPTVVWSAHRRGERRTS